MRGLSTNRSFSKQAAFINDFYPYYFIHIIYAEQHAVGIKLSARRWGYYSKLTSAFWKVSFGIIFIECRGNALSESIAL